MRLLLLLTAFLTALTGAVSGAAVAAEPVQASASATPTRAHAAIAVTVVGRMVEQAFAAGSGWHVARATLAQDARASFGERRRL